MLRPGPLCSISYQLLPRVSVLVLRTLRRHVCATVRRKERSCKSKSWLLKLSRAARPWWRQWSGWSKDKLWVDDNFARCNSRAIYQNGCPSGETCGPVPACWTAVMSPSLQTRTGNVHAATLYCRSNTQQQHFFLTVQFSLYIMSYIHEGTARMCSDPDGSDISDIEALTLSMSRSLFCLRGCGSWHGSSPVTNAYFISWEQCKGKKKLYLRFYFTVTVCHTFRLGNRHYVVL